MTLEEIRDRWPGVEFSTTSKTDPSGEAGDYISAYWRGAPSIQVHNWEGKNSVEDPIQQLDDILLATKVALNTPRSRYREEE